MSISLISINDITVPYMTAAFEPYDPFMIPNDKIIELYDDC